MRLNRWLVASVIAAPLTIIGASSAQAGILGCNEQNGNRPATTDETGSSSSDDPNEAPFFSLGDSIDIITIKSEGRHRH